MLELLKNFTKAAKHTEISLYTFTKHSDSVFKVRSVYLVLVKLLDKNQTDFYSFLALHSDFFIPSDFSVL